MNDKRKKWNLGRLEFIYPAARTGGFYNSPNETVIGTLHIDGKDVEVDPKVMQTPHSKVKYAYWDFTHNALADSLFFAQTSYIVSFDTVFDEEKAKEIPWPKDWNESASRFLEPVIDRINKPIDQGALVEFENLVDRWVQGNDPKSIDQLTLVKYLTGHVLEHVEVTQSHTSLSPRVNTGTQQRLLENGFSTSASDVVSGFNVRSAELIAQDPSYSNIFEMGVLLTAVLREVGVPARHVICYNQDVSDHGTDRFVLIVEFAMYDHVRDQNLWIPIDLRRLRENGRRVNVYEQRWDYFGNHDELHDLVPISYYFHPPVNFDAYRFPAVYGFRTDPTIGGEIVQILTFNVLNTPARGSDFKKKPESKRPTNTP